MISTHTSLAGRDTVKAVSMTFDNVISTHTSLAGRDDAIELVDLVLNDFYSHVPRGT